MANFGFNLGDIDADAGPSGSYEPIPDGEYQLMCEEAEQRQTKAGTGQYIRAKFRVLGPTNANRIIFMNFNTHNPSSKAEEIGRRQLAGWARACNLPNAGDSDQLVNRPFNAEVGTEKGSGDYGPQNIITGFKTPNSGSSAPKTTPAPAKSTPAAAASSAAPSPSKPAGKKAPWDD
jgi:hypothetical protein